AGFPEPEQRAVAAAVVDKNDFVLRRDAFRSGYHAAHQLINNQLFIVDGYDDGKQDSTIGQHGCKESGIWAADAADGVGRSEDAATSVGKLGLRQREEELD